ncbi:MAG: pyridoxamine 5'-phosphate oxidase [Phycisphaeraceae bacterium]|nr:pyridoxamine 5'-phosphate oxidase [Phycisphaeraceae bacterium]
MNISDLRQEYMLAELLESQVDSDPMKQFSAWFDQAVETNEGAAFEPNAMTLATGDGDGRISARIVLLKELDERGLVFFSNYASHKARDLAVHPQAALVFYWPWLERQVRVEGVVERISRARSLEYFRSRPRASQLGALASRQSAPIPGREALEKEYAHFENLYADTSVPMPEDWGGYCLIPDRLEFWQGRRSRLHDRILYVRKPDGGWRIQRISP